MVYVAVSFGIWPQKQRAACLRRPRSPWLAGCVGGWLTAKLARQPDPIVDYWLIGRRLNRCRRCALGLRTLSQVDREPP
jgi:hypothetical protein